MNQTIYSPLCLLLLFLTPSFAQPQKSQLKLTSGKEIFEAACVGCHGPDGKGQPQPILGFLPPSTFPDFSDCPTTTPELDLQWKAIVTNGGPGRGFSEIMPSFKEALTSNQIEMVIGYLRSLCKEDNWPKAEFNLPRPLYTEKAYPENETVITNNLNANKNGYFGSNVVYEKRYGARTNLEFVVPFVFSQERLNGKPLAPWYGGVGDVTVELKRVVYHNPRSGTLVTAAGEFNFATGNKDKGLGNGVMVLEPFVSVAQLLPKRSFVQIQTGYEFPTHTDDRPRESFFRAAIGKSFSPEQGLGRTWSPMLEILTAREYETGAKVEWDLAPQMQVTLNKRQHIRANVGVRMPTNNFNGRAIQVGFYLLWDWFDGGFLQGWR